MLIDSIDHSAADYVPATLQDNHRGVLFGTNTAGAGGNQAHVGTGDVCTTRRGSSRLECAPPDVIAALKTLGFSGFYYTVAVGVRPGDRVIENVGVSPDVPYRIQAEDLLTGFAPMRRRILDTLQKLASSTRASAEP
jgi:C-terminal processing protease CtpA/Prc